MNFLHEWFGESREDQIGLGMGYLGVFILSFIGWLEINWGALF